MEIILADKAGHCFGVKRALDLTEESLKNSKTNYAFGPIIHNPQTIKRFEKKGLKTIDDPYRIEKGTLITRSHGIRKDIKEKIEKNKKINLIDTTCPFVISVQEKAKEYNDRGYKVIIIGDRSHPEVISINSWANDEGIIINSPEDATKLDFYDKICIVSQTTNKRDLFKEVSDIVKNKCNEIKIFNTICNATYERQEACKETAKKVDAMIVIGGYNSSNTNKLAEVAKKHCKNVFHIEEAKELPLQKILNFNKIGITAGASTPDWIIKEVIVLMNNINDNEILEENEMLQAIENSMIRINKGDIVRGEVIYVTDKEVMVNINYTSDGIITKEELSNDPNVQPKDLYEEGDSIDVYIVRLDDGEGNVLLSTKRLSAIKGWEELEELYENKEIIECKVLNNVKGGLSVLVNELTGFMPASQISVDYVDDLTKYRGKTLKAKIIDLDRRKNRIILSSRILEEKALQDKQEELWDELEVGQVLEGRVARLTNFGAFVDIGGLDGLAHISDLSWLRINHPSEVVKEGESIKVKVLDFDKEKNRISLGIKQLEAKPWDVFLENNEKGDIVEGTVVNLLDFGAFVRLEEKVDGLVHVSQISDDHVKKPADVLNKGDKVIVKIMDIDEEGRKISLSMKEAKTEKENEEAKEYIEKTEED